MPKSLEQLKHNKEHYQSIYYYVNAKGKPVVLGQIKKLTGQIKQLHLLAKNG